MFPIAETTVAFIALSRIARIKVSCEFGAVFLFGVPHESENLSELESSVFCMSLSAERLLCEGTTRLLK